MENEQPTAAKTQSIEREQVKDIALKSLAALGLITLLAMGTWGSFQVIRKSPEMISGITASVRSITARLFPVENPRLEINLATLTLKSGESFSFAWQKEGNASQYSLVYECADDLTFLAETEREGETKRIGCGEPHAFSTAATSLTLTPLSPNHRFLDATLKLRAIRNNEIVAEDSVLLTIVNEKQALNLPGEAATSTPALPTGASPSGYIPTYTTVTVPPYSDPLGYVDLAVEIIGVGTVDENDVFISAEVLDRSEEMAVQFSVKNIGTKTSATWDFQVELPTSPRHTYKTRSEQQALAPGDRMEYTLQFDCIARRDTGSITIDIDTEETSGDSNRSNNRASAQFDIQN